MGKFKKKKQKIRRKKPKYSGLIGPKRSSLKKKIQICRA
jgi:hypothetical protein